MLGELNEIFNRIIKIGTLLTLNILKKNYKQKKIKITKVYKRRKPQQSEITLREFKFSNANYLYKKFYSISDTTPYGMR